MTYALTKEKLFLAKQNARKIRTEVEKYDGNKKIYERNPYTNLDLLINEIQDSSFAKENKDYLTSFWNDF